MLDKPAGGNKLTHKIRVGFGGESLAAIQVIDSAGGQINLNLVAGFNIVNCLLAFEQREADIYGISEEDAGECFGYYAGNTRSGKTDLGFAAFEAAVDINHATGWKLSDQLVYLGGYAAVYLFSSLEFIQSDETALEINNQYEIGLTLSSTNEFTILGMGMERIGLGYVFSEDFHAIRLVFSFPY